MASESSPNAAGAIPGAGFDFKAMFDAMEFARRSWSSSFSMPESLTPTMDPQELDKRIADLRTVEQWLMLNLNLLRGSIQTLELQRTAIDSLHSFGKAARAAAQPPGPEAARPADSQTAGFDPQAWWQTLQQQFQRVAESALASSSAAMSAAADPPAQSPTGAGAAARPAAAGKARAPKRRARTGQRVRTDRGAS